MENRYNIQKDIFSNKKFVSKITKVIDFTENLFDNLTIPPTLEQKNQAYYLINDQIEKLDLSSVGLNSKDVTDILTSDLLIQSWQYGYKPYIWKHIYIAANGKNMLSEVPGKNVGKKNIPLGNSINYSSKISTSNTTESSSSEESSENIIRKAPVRKAPVRKAPIRKAPIRKAPVRKAPVRKNISSSSEESSEKEENIIRKTPVRTSPVRKAPVRKNISSSSEESSEKEDIIKKSSLKKAPIRRLPVRK